MNIIAETATSESKKPPYNAGKSKDKKISGVDDIEIHTDTDEPDKTKIRTESDVFQSSKKKDPIHKLPKVNKEERIQRVEVLGPVIKLNKSLDEHENEETEINKDIVVTGKPKLNGKVMIDTTFQYKHPHKMNKENSDYTEKLAGFSIDHVVTLKSPSNSTADDMRLKTTTHARKHKAYHDYSAAHKVLTSNIEKLRNVLKAIEDVPTNNNNNNNSNDNRVGRPDALLGQKNPSLLQLSGTPQVNTIPPYLPQAPSDFKVLKSQSSTQTNITKLPGAPVTPQSADKMVSANTPPIQDSAVTVNSLQTPRTKQSQLPGNSGIPLGANSFPQASAPGLHVVQGNGNLPNDRGSTQATNDVFDHLASELVDQDATSHSNWVNKLRPGNESLQETFKELSPDESAKICKLVLVTLRIKNRHWKMAALLSPDRLNYSK